MSNPSKEQRAGEGKGQPKGATSGVTPDTSSASLTSNPQCEHNTLTHFSGDSWRCRKCRKLFAFPHSAVETDGITERDKLVAALNRLCPHRGDMPPGMYETPCPRCLSEEPSERPPNYNPFHAMEERLEAATRPAEKASCAHTWTVLGHIGDPVPDQRCDHGCGLRWGDRFSEKASCECICPRRDTDDEIIYTHVACPVHALNGTGE